MKMFMENFILNLTYTHTLLINEKVNLLITGLWTGYML